MIDFAMKKESGKMVDALDEGRIVRVPEDYARAEGLPILRMIQDSSEVAAKNIEMVKEQTLERVKISPFESLRKPVKNDSNILASLSSNFQWTIIQKRRERGISRKSFANMLGVNEEEVKMLENGILPAEDFVLIGAIERYFGISLRKDGSTYVVPTIDELKKRNAEVGKEREREKAKKREEFVEAKDDVLSDSELFSDDLDLFKD